MKKVTGFVSAVALALMMFAPSNASAQQVNTYVGHGQGYGNGYPHYGYGYGYGYPRYGYGYSSYGYSSYPGYYGYGYGRPYYGTYWGHGRRVARRVYRRRARWY